MTPLSLVGELAAAIAAVDCKGETAIGGAELKRRNAYLLFLRPLFLIIGVGFARDFTRKEIQANYVRHGE